jgi:hypothetical protein
VVGETQREDCGVVREIDRKLEPVFEKGSDFPSTGGEDPNAMESCCDEERFCQDWGSRHKNLSCDLRYVTKGWRSGGA